MQSCVGDCFNRQRMNVRNCSGAYNAKTKLSFFQRLKIDRLQKLIRYTACAIFFCLPANRTVATAVASLRSTIAIRSTSVSGAGISRIAMNILLVTEHNHRSKTMFPFLITVSICISLPFNLNSTKSPLSSNI